MSGAFRPTDRSIHPPHRRRHNVPRQDLSPSPTTTQDASNPDSFMSSAPLFNDPNFLTRVPFHHTTRVKLDSAAGATGTSVAQLPGRHFIVPPWLAIVVWMSILFFIGLTVSGFTLSYSARKEFRMRVEEQRKAQMEAQAEHETAECKIPITSKEFKSFTRKSIMVLNSNPPPAGGRHQHNNSVYSIDNAGDLRPRNMFNRPPRNSILVAEITSSGNNFSGDDPFYEFSRQIRQEGLWDLAARKSKAISVVSLSSMMPKMGRRNSNRFTMMDVAEEELDEQSFTPHLNRDNLARPSNNRALRYLEAEQGDNLRIEDHMVQPNRFVPPVPKLPVEFSTDQPGSGEKLSSFNDISFLSHNDHKQRSFPDQATPPPRARIHPQDTTSRRARATEQSNPLEPMDSQSRIPDVLSPPERSASLRGKSGKRAHEYPKTPDSLVTITVPPSDESPDDAMARYASTRASTPSPLPILNQPAPTGDFSPDDAVAQYASARAAGALSPLPKAQKSGSVLGFMRRSLTQTPQSPGDGRDSTASYTNTDYAESATEQPPLTQRSEGFKDLSLQPENGDEHRKTFSVIFEEEDEEDYFGPIKSNQQPFSLSDISSWDNSEVRSPDSGNVSLPRRLPQAAIGRTLNHGSSLRSNPASSPTSVAMTASSSSSNGTRSTLGSSGARGSPKDSSSLGKAPLTLKRNPSLTATPYARVPHQRVERDLSTRRSPNTPKPSSPLRTTNATAAPVMRRTASAQARIPLSGTMSSGGCRESSFIP
ncbi:hypothetical protein PSTG_16467 [Puccinia striiformis f. sp. tritici PST-78]|uniref:Uncharacterized protein n=1 Tax=Puccinia striiformis f. sp. tritici PST-78 TaxID=1165861 RepID=A0A0L0USW0_9BASI|nr:hypothetical protein PSTG_16467 [Puccinia striiformis f. sp. tritici PST-78]